MAQPWEEKERFIMSIETTFEDALAVIEPRITSQLNEILARSVSTQRGQILLTDQLFQELEIFKQNFIEALRGEGYVDVVNAMINELPDLDPFTISTQRQVNRIDVDDFISDNPVKTIQINRINENLRGSGIDSQVLVPMNDIIMSNATEGISIAEATDKLTEFLSSEGSDEFLKFANRAATDGINQYNGSINQAIQNQFELDGIFYVGSIIEDSRGFCREMVLKEKRDFEEIDVLIERYQSKSGLLYGLQTDRNNFTTNRGGIRCRHEAIPTRL